MSENDNSGVVGASIQMTIVSILLFWLPLGGSAIAGYVGGKNAGGVTRGLTAAILPGIILAVLIFAASSTIAGLPLIGAIIGAGAVIAVAAYSMPLIAGAVIGGLLA